VKLDDPGHPLVAAFNGQDFDVADEIYQFRDPYSREKLRVLLSLDVEKINMNKKGIKREDKDFAVAWIRQFGKGRAFYFSLGHRHEIFWNPQVRYATIDPHKDPGRVGRPVLVPIFHEQPAANANRIRRRFRGAMAGQVAIAARDRQPGGNPLRESKTLLLAVSVFAAVIAAPCVVQSADGPVTNVSSLKGELSRMGAQKLGLAVIVEPDDPLLAAERLGRYASLVQMLVLDERKVLSSRETLREKGGRGVSLRCLRGNLLPYVDNLVNLVVLPASCPVKQSEVERVLAPHGVCLRSSNGKWTSWRKARPEEMGQWSHYLHDASNNAVGKDRLVDTPRGIQWVAAPRFSRHHDHISSITAMASWEGRLFYVEDQGSTMSIHLPGQWALVARDAFNGAALWEKKIDDWVNPLWPLKSGPVSILRRLIASGDRVYVTLGLSAPVSCLDAETGKEQMQLPGSANTQEMILHGGKLLCLVEPTAPDWDTYLPANQKSPQEQAVVDKRWSFKREPSKLQAYDAEEGALLWQIDAPVAPLSLAAVDEKVFFFDGQKIHAVDLKNGREAWVSAPVDAGVRASAGPFFGVNLVATHKVVLFSGGNRRMSGWDAHSGKKLWQAPHLQSGYRSPEDLFVIDDHVFSEDISHMRSSGEVQVRDLVSGELVRTLAKDTTMEHWPHQRCHRSYATERFILSSRTGIEFCDVKDGSWHNHHWARGACLVGFMPCNGLIYAPSHHCLCFVASKLEGFNALTPSSALSDEDAVGSRLRRGPAYELPRKRPSQPAAPGAWPMHRHDAKRSGHNPVSVGTVKGISWATPLSGRLTSPVIARDTLVVADADRGTIHALNAKSGERLWQFMAGGPVDTAPTLSQGRVVFGCADGWIYCLSLTDGQIAWRFFAALGERQHVAYGKLESVWPLHGSILIKDDVIHAVAGRSRFTDSGMRLLQLDPFTGAKLSERVLDERREGDRKPVQQNFNQQFRTWLARQKSGKGKPVTLMTFNDVGLTDLLTMDHETIFMRGHPLRFGDEDRPASRGTRWTVPWGLITGEWSHRAFWRYAGSPSSRILVFNDSGQVFGYGFKLRYQRLLESADHHLYGKSGKPGKEAFLWPGQKLPFLVRAMVLAGDKLVVAGPPDYGQFEKADAYTRRNDTEFCQNMMQQADAWAGKKGGMLWMISAQDGMRLAELQLSSPPVFDGMASTADGIYLSTMDGQVLFLSGSRGNDNR